MTAVIHLTSWVWLEETMMQKRGDPVRTFLDHAAASQQESKIAGRASVDCRTCKTSH